MHPDIRLVYPHEMCREEAGVGRSQLKSERADLPYPRALATTYGNVVHKALELSAQNLRSGGCGTLPWASMWGDLTIKALGLGMSPRELERVQDILIREVEATLHHPQWRGWILESEDVETELSLVHRISDSRLMRGAVDLVAHGPHGASVVVDYKTTNIPPEVQTLEELRGFCAEAGYFRQLALYLEALRVTDPHREFQGVVWLTKRSVAVYRGISAN